MAEWAKLKDEHLEFDFKLGENAENLLQNLECAESLQNKSMENEMNRMQKIKDNFLRGFYVSEDDAYKINNWESLHFGEIAGNAIREIIAKLNIETKQENEEFYETLKTENGSFKSLSDIFEELSGKT